MNKTNYKYSDIHKDLVEGCRRFDNKSQFKIYKLYYKAMYNISLRIVKDPMEAEDIMQEAFLSAFEKIETFSGSVSFGAWLKKIVENRSLDYLRRKRLAFEELKDAQAVNIPEEETFQEELRMKIEKIRKIVMLLPKGLRIVLSLNLFEGLDHEEIGQVLGIDTNSARSQFYRARTRLLEKLNIHQISYHNNGEIIN